jgi:hypothetical protein
MFVACGVLDVLVLICVDVLGVGWSDSIEHGLAGQCNRGNRHFTCAMGGRDGGVDAGLCA